MPAVSQMALMLPLPGMPLPGPVCVQVITEMLGTQVDRNTQWNNVRNQEVGQSMYRRSCWPANCELCCSPLPGCT